jgi:Domain of unknown function (DUF222)
VVTVALPADDALARIGTAVDELETEDRGSWSGPARAARVLEVAQARERVDAALVQAVADWDRDRSWQAEEATSATAWLSHHASISTGEATRLVRSARLTRAYAPVERALATGEITTTAVAELARVESRREDLFERDVEVLVDAAARHRPSELGIVLRRWRHLADDVASNEEPARVHDRRYLYASTTVGGTVRIDGELDPDGGARFLAALDRLTRPDPTDDPLGARTLAQLRADALVEIAEAALGDTASGSGVKTAVEVLIDVDTLEGRIRGLEQATCDILGVGPVPVETVRRILCDSTVGRIVTAPGEVLDVGRPVRFPTAAQRRAVVARDRHCTWPTCDRPARWCDVHHLVEVRFGGRTILTNLVLLCRRHHTAVHERGWTMVRHDDGRIEVHPPAQMAKVGRDPP